MKIFLIFILICSSLNAGVSILDVITAIEKVESNQDKYAINEKENALGCLQIRPIMVKDYNRITGVGWCSKNSKIN